MSTMEREKFEVNLQMFADGGAAGADGATGTGDAAAGAENAPKADIKSGSSRRKSGEFDNVIFGKQETSAADNADSLDTGGNNPMGAGEDGDVIITSNTLEERRKAYNEFIEANKDLDNERFQQVFNRRFKDDKAMQAKIDAQQPVIDMLMSKYGLNDVSELEAAINDDYSFWEGIAEEKGMSVEQYKRIQKLERENAQFKEMQRQRQGQMQMEQRFRQWDEQAKAVKGKYPSFDFRTECQNPQFISLLRSGVDVEHAYTVLHHDEMIQNAAMYAAKTADAQAQARIKAKAMRPTENGISSQSAAIVKSDVSKLTKAEREEIARRAARGERISF